MMTIYTRCLRRAAYVMGSIEALRRRLDVPEQDLIGWLAGTSSVPEEIFLRAIDIVVDDQVKQISGGYLTLKSPTSTDV